MPGPELSPRSRDALPRLGSGALRAPVLLDTNVFIQALSGRGPAQLRILLANLPRSFVSGPVIAELSWPRGRLDPSHPDTATVLARYDGLLGRIPPANLLLPEAADWALAGELAGRVARGLAGGARSIRTAFDRVELMNDALTALAALRIGATLVTSDGDFDLFQQLEPALEVAFYE